MDKNSKEKQIEEIAKQIKYMTGSYTSDAEDCARVLYEQMNYCKQSEGEWDKPIEHGLPYKANHLGFVCSYCCSWSDNRYNFCPNCGAKMKGK